MRHQPGENTSHGGTARTIGVKNLAKEGPQCQCRRIDSFAPSGLFGTQHLFKTFCRQHLGEGQPTILSKLLPQGFDLVRGASANRIGHRRPPCLGWWDEKHPILRPRRFSCLCRFVAYSYNFGKCHSRYVPFVLSVIGGFAKQLQPARGPVERMVNIAGRRLTCTAWHGRSLIWPARGASSKRDTSRMALTLAEPPHR